MEEETDEIEISKRRRGRPQGRRKKQTNQQPQQVSTGCLNY